jgi:NAD(P)-dependent dehydrogenase (short-subunit alcohol dehydrogenase family)
MDSPPDPAAVLRAGAFAGVEFEANDGAIAARLEQLGATRGDGALIHRATTTDPQQALDDAWDAIRAHALPPRATGRLIVLIAPPPGDPHAAAARAGLETLARALSIEWARHGTRPVVILPGAGTADGELAELVAFLASPAGAYYSGCAFTLRSPTAPRPSPPSASPAPPRTPPARSPSG